MNNQEDIFKPYKRKRSFEEVSDEIKARIIKGDLKVGDKLPPESEIARQFQVGRHTIRDAMRILEQSGFISIERGASGGPVITDTVLSKLSSLFLDAFRWRRPSLKEFTLARSELERLVFIHAVRNMDDSDINALKENLNRAREKLKNNTVAFNENMKFHRLLAEASKNYLFVIVTEAVCTIHSDFFTKSTKEDVLSLSKRTVRAHEAVVDALSDGLREEALVLFEKHLHEVATTYYKSLEKKT